MYRWLKYSALILAFVSGSTFAAQVDKNVVKDALVFATPPTQSPEVTLINYQPLVDYISDAIGQEIVIKPAKNFQEYSTNMQAGMYDIVFDGPHFIKWRIEQLKHVVVAKQPGELHFVIVVRDNSTMNTLRDLWGQPVCSPPVPHLGTLTLLDLFHNPMREPQIIPVQSFKDGLNCLHEGRAKAALVRDKFWINTKMNKTGLRVMHYTRRVMPARALTVNYKIDIAAQRKIIRALTSKQGKEYSEKAFSTIGGGKFVRAKTAEYLSTDDVIKVVWGFHD